LSRSFSGCPLPGSTGVHVTVQLRNFLRCVAAVAPLLASPLRTADAQRNIAPYIGAGVASGIGGLGDGTERGWVVFGGVNVAVASKPGLVVGVTASYAHIPYEGSFGESTNIPALFGEMGYTFAWSPSNALRPYFRGGLGVLQHRYDPGSTGYPGETETRIGLGAGGGVSILFRVMTLLLGAHVVTAADTQFLTFYGGVGSAPPRKR